MPSDLTSAVLESVARHRKRPALVADGKTTTYGDLADRAARVSTLLGEHRRDVTPRFGAVMGSRTTHCFTGVLATLFSGAGYIPLHPLFPVVRTEHMIRASGATSLVIEVADLLPLVSMLQGLPPLVVVVPDVEDIRELAERLPSHRIFGARDIAAAAPFDPRGADPEDAPYIIFTSGSTGTPKGVVVRHRNVMACLDNYGERYAITADDRFAQNSELTFDVSVWEMFLCWTRGACLFVAPPARRPCPSTLVKEAALTVWFSVPSMVLFMRRLGALKSGAFPSVRVGLFAGERLSVEVARAWAAAAPNAIVENLYGPTELTIVFTAHRFEDDPAQDGHASVPIGLPLRGSSAAIVDEGLARLHAGQPGEICVEGAQVVAGYWGDEAQTNDRFVRMPWDDRGRRWYRSGDLGRMSVDGVLEHLGRLDEQVKVRGFRVELGEVETALRRILDTDGVAAITVASPARETVEIVAFVVKGEVNDSAVQDGLARLLPVYMHPSRVIPMNALPLNANGKTDKGALRRLYEESHAIAG